MSRELLVVGAVNDFDAKKSTLLKAGARSNRNRCKQDPV